MSAFLELDQTETYHLLERFYKLKPELSYETIPHTKVSTEYNLCLAIPIGTKCYAWLTYYGKHDVCFIMEINKERKISRITYTILHRISKYTNGTLLYGTIMTSNDFIIEDILLFQGISAKTTLMNERLGFLYSFMKEFPQESTRFYLPVLWYVSKMALNGSNESYECTYDIPIKNGIEYENRYPIHHIQYRCLRVTAPYLNVYPAKKGFQKNTNTLPQELELYIPYKHINTNKPQYKQLTVFKVMADFQYDIYRLYAFGSQKTPIYYNVTCIPTYRNSVFMNRIFRNIKENDNLDAIEESDDEDDFENMDPVKYVDLKKCVLIECRFNTKFKKWVPIRVVSDKEKVVHIGQL